MNPYVQMQMQQAAQMQRYQVGACGGVGAPAMMNWGGGGYPYGGPCGPLVFPPGYVAQAAMGGVAGKIAPQQPIGLQCGPILPPTTAFTTLLVTTPALPGETCEACCTSQGCFCVSDITVGNCGQCVFLISSIKSGLCELIQCGSIMADTFYCDCSHPPLKSSMLTPGIEFCITVQNIKTVVIPDGSTPAAAAALRAAGAATFFATVWGLPGDNNCEPCLY
jgi:hypothetical protein